MKVIQFWICCLHQFWKIDIGQYVKIAKMYGSKRIRMKERSYIVTVKPNIQFYLLYLITLNLMSIAWDYLTENIIQKVNGDNWEILNGTQKIQAL